MKNHEKYLSFLESISDEETQPLMTTISKAFSVCFEGDYGKNVRKRAMEIYNDLGDEWGYTEDKNALYGELAKKWAGLKDNFEKNAFYIAMRKIGNENKDFDVNKLKDRFQGIEKESAARDEADEKAFGSVKKHKEEMAKKGQERNVFSAKFKEEEEKNIAHLEEVKKIIQGKDWRNTVKKYVEMFNDDKRAYFAELKRLKTLKTRPHMEKLYDAKTQEERDEILANPSINPMGMQAAKKVHKAVKEYGKKDKKPETMMKEMAQDRIDKLKAKYPEMDNNGLVLQAQEWAKSDNQNEAILAKMMLKILPKYKAPKRKARNKDKEAR